MFISIGILAQLPMSAVVDRVRSGQAVFELMDGRIADINESRGAASWNGDSLYPYFKTMSKHL